MQENNLNKPQSHKMTVGQMADLKTKQIQGETTRVKANKNPAYSIPEHEQHLLHATIENTEFDLKTGQKKSTPTLQSFYPHEFAKMVSEKAFPGLKVTIVHDPRTDTELAADKKTITSGLLGDKPLERMNKNEIHARFLRVTGQEVPAGMSVEEIRQALTEFARQAGSSPDVDPLLNAGAGTPDVGSY